MPNRPIPYTTAVIKSANQKQLKKRHWYEKPLWPCDVHSSNIPQTIQVSLLLMKKKTDNCRWLTGTSMAPAVSQYTSKIQADNPIWDTWLVELIRCRDIIRIRPHGPWYLCYQSQHLDTTWVDPQSPSIGMLMSSFSSFSHQTELDSCSNYIVFNEHGVVNLKGPFLEHCEKQKPWISP